MKFLIISVFLLFIHSSLSLKLQNNTKSKNKHHLSNRLQNKLAVFNKYRLRSNFLLIRS